MMAAFALLFVVFSTCYLLSEGKTINPSSRKLLDKMQNVKRIAKQYMDDNKLAFAPSADYPYWNFLPQHVGTFIPGGDSVEWSSPCFGSNKAKAQFTSDNTAIEITVVSSKPTTSDGHCEDIYAALSTAATSWFNSIHTNKLHTAVTTTITYTLPSDITDSETWDVQNKGVRFFRYLLPAAETLSNLIVTLETFAPEQLPDVPKKFADMGIDFMSKYAHFDVSPRDPALNRVPDESEVKSGDSFYLMRFDGLNPLLAWAMGSTTGHVTTALWIDGELYVCESTVDSAYWPTDGIQRTPYRTWINQTIAADFQVVYVKLNEEARKNYNETAAVEFFKQSEGLNYGFKAIMWGWLDTEKDNLPCLPPDFSSNCFQWELLEPVLAHADRVDNYVGDLIWNPGFAKRLGLPDDNTQRTADLYRETARQSMTTAHVLTIPEQDTWLYNTTRYNEPAVGRSMVCCVFVCSTWKAAGVFGELTDQINCAEQTNWDDYVLTIHQDKFEQIVGTYSLDLNNFHTKDPYAHMAETCPSLAPDYKKPADC